MRTTQQHHQHSRAREEWQEYRRPSQKPRFSQATDEVFKCKHCRRLVAPLPSGGHHRNHCPFCLHSRHVDDRQTGDRLSDCGASMQPIGSFQRRTGEHVLLHRCLGCGFERCCRIAADDDFDLVLALPEVPPQTGLEMKAARRLRQTRAPEVIDIITDTEQDVG